LIKRPKEFENDLEIKKSLLFDDDVAGDGLFLTKDKKKCSQNILYTKSMEVFLSIFQT
jgi:hypothetical protein